MAISNKKRKWISIGVGVIGIVTIVGLSDLMFVVPQQTPVDSSVATDTPVPFTVATSSPSDQSASLPVTPVPETTSLQGVLNLPSSSPSLGN